MTSMKTASGKDKKSKREVRGAVSGNLGFITDGPLENVWGGAGEVQKKYSRKGKLNEKNFMHAN